MRFKMGFVAGLAVGYWLGTTPADQRKAKLEQTWTSVRENPRIRRVSDTVTRDAKRLGDAVEQRIVKGADGAVDVIAGGRRARNNGPGGDSPEAPDARSA